MKKSFVLLLFLGSVLSVPVNSQVNNFKTYSIDDGLPVSTILSLVQDSRGYLWLGTQGSGACRFDGLNFIIFDEEEGLANNMVTRIMEDSRGYLWFATYEGISCFDGHIFRTINDTTGLLGNQTWSLFEDKNKNIWAGTDKGLNKILGVDTNDSLKARPYSFSDGLNAALIFDIYEDKYDRLWLGTYNDGVYIVSFEDEEIADVTHLFGGIIPSDQVINIEEDRQGNLWFATTDAGVFKITGFTESERGTVTAYNRSNGLTDNHVWDIMVDSEDRLWFATDKGGIIRFDDTGFKEYSDKQGFPDNQVFCLMQDSEENIWAGTVNNGIVKIIGDHFSHYTEKEGLPINLVYDIEQDRQGNYWLATLGAGLVQLSFMDNEPLFKEYTTGNGLSDNYLNSLAFDQEENLWIATKENGISRFDGRKFTRYTTDNGLVNNQVNCIFADSQGDIWCGTKYGISRFTDKGFFSITSDEYEILPHNDIQTIIQDRKGAIWIGTFAGLVRIDGNEMRSFDEVEGLDHKLVYSLAEDRDGNIWIGTNGGGLFKYNPRKNMEKPIELAAGDSLLSSSNIVSLIFQNDSILLVGTNKGFDKLFLNADLEIDHVKKYHASNGFIGMENNLNSILKDSDDAIWFGTAKGITRYDPMAEKTNVKPPMIHITEIDLSYVNIDWSEKADSILPWCSLPYDLKLSYHDNHLTFNWIGISLSNPEEVLYKFKLEPRDKVWSPTWQLPFHIYSGIAPGDYTFMVTSRNENGIWNEEPLTFSFTIKSPFYQTWWFITILVIIAVAGIIIYVKLREKQLIREKNILEQKVHERTLEIRQQKTEIEQKNVFLKEANVEITCQKELIEKKNKDITDSIRYAKRIQEAVLPSEKLLKENVKDSFILYLPKDIVSGDFYWVRQKDGSLIIAAADCTGHGVPGAFMSMLGITFLNEIVERDNVVSPDKILNLLRENVITHLKQRRVESDSKDGMDMAICTLDMESGHLFFAGANNPVYLVRNHKVMETKGDKMPVAIHTKMHDFARHRISPEPGDSIYIFSDGYADQFGGPKGKKFKYRQLRDLLCRICDDKMENQKEILYRNYQDWRGENDQVDDIVIIGFRI